MRNEQLILFPVVTSVKFTFQKSQTKKDKELTKCFQKTQLWPQSQIYTTDYFRDTQKQVTKKTHYKHKTKHLLYRHYNTKVSSLFSTANPIILFARYKSVAANSRSRFPHIRVSVLPVPPLFDFVTCLPAAVILRSVWRPYSFALLPCRRTHTSANLNETGP